MASRSPLLLVAIGALGLAAPRAAAGQEEFRWSGRVEPGRTIEVKGVNGGIRAERGTGPEVEVIARKTARRSDPASVSVEVLTHEGGVTVCALYPTPSGQRANECAPGSAGRMSTRNNDVRVEFTVRVPDGVHLAARTVNGSVEARGLRADVDVNTTNGPIRVSTTGLARARTTNGAIEVEMGSGDGTEDLEFRTTNGGITLVVSGELDADIEARTTNGSFSSDYPVTVQGTFGPRRVEGVIGRGGRRLVLHTTNGNVRIRRAGGQAYESGVVSTPVPD